MYFVLRILLLTVFASLVFVLSFIYFLFSPRNPKHVYHLSHIFGKVSSLFGMTLSVRESDISKDVKTGVYIANHQNNWDLLTLSNAVRPGVVTVGKKSLLFIPFFGLIYWLSGNILIDRNNRSKAVGTINQVVDKIKERHVSIWMFPEGTRSRGRGLLPFKAGAFHAAIQAGVPIVPVVCSSTQHVNPFKRKNGHVIVEILDPISTEGMKKEDVRKLSARCHEIMAARIVELDLEVAALNAQTVKV